MDSTVIILIMLAAMIVILIVFAFILVMGGADSAPANDDTVVIRVDREHAQEVADIFRDLLCDKFEYNARHERQRDADIVSDVVNLTPPPENGPGRKLFKKIVSYNELDPEEKASLLSELALHGIPIDVSKLEGNEEMVPEDEDEGVTHASSLSEFDAAAGQTEEEEKEDDNGTIDGEPDGASESGDAGDDVARDGEEPAGTDETALEEEPVVAVKKTPAKGSRKKAVSSRNRSPRVKPVRTAESDRLKESSAKGGKDHAAIPAEPSAPASSMGILDDKDFGDREFGIESI